MTRKATAMGWAALAALLASAVPWTAYADPAYMRSRFSIRGAMGLGGEALFEGGGVAFRDDLQTTFGVSAEVESPLARAYSIGVELGAHAWRSDLAEGLSIERNVVVDLSAVNRLRLAWGDDHSHGAFYLGAPVDVSLSLARDEYAAQLSEGSAGTEEIRLGTGGGLNVGGRVGVQLFLGKVFGLTVEAGYQWRLLRHGATGLVGQDHVQLRFGQAILQGGFTFAF